MALSMTACGSGGGSTDTQGSGSSDGSPTTLNLILRAGAYADVIKECLPKFEEEHNVKCEVQELSESDPASPSTPSTRRVPTTCAW